MVVNNKLTFNNWISFYEFYHWMYDVYLYTITVYEVLYITTWFTLIMGQKAFQTVLDLS